jgi:hypothetical protein
MGFSSGFGSSGVHYEQKLPRKVVTARAPIQKTRAGFVIRLLAG